MTKFAGPTPNEKETHNDLKITQEDIDEFKKVSSSLADALLNMSLLLRLKKAMKEVRNEDTFDSNELDDLDHYHKLVVDGVGKERSLIFAFDITRKTTEADFQELKAQYYKVLGEKLGLDNSNEVRKWMLVRSAIKAHL